MDQSRWAERLDELRRMVTKTKSRIGSEEALLDAYLYVSRVRCGRATCKCMRTEYRHEKWCISFMENGRSRTLTVPQDWLPRIARATNAYRDARTLVREFSAGLQAAADAVNERMAARIGTGRELLAELVAAKADRTGKGGDR
jgi:hypothetical protein